MHTYTCGMLNVEPWAKLDTRTHTLTVSPSVPGKRTPVVPHIVRPISPRGQDLRKEIRIPHNATVFGRHGGRHSFDVPEARLAMLHVARARPDIYFLLLNTAPFGPQAAPALKCLRGAIPMLECILISGLGTRVGAQGWGMGMRMSMVMVMAWLRSLVATRMAAV